MESINTKQLIKGWQEYVRHKKALRVDFLRMTMPELVPEAKY